MTTQTQETSAFAIASLLLGISCYVNFLGIEKAVLAFVFAFLAVREVSRRNKKGKNLAFLGVVLAVIFVLVVFLYAKATTIE